MERSLLLSAFLSVTTLTQGAVTPGQRTSLYAHMLDVNAQWRLKDPASTVGSTTIAFGNDAERIAMHLHLVATRLKVHAPEGLSADQFEQRRFLLTRLDHYADRGLFPQNYVLPYRNPVFIDPHGTACAVGQLIIESGHRDLAERISRTMNLAYLLDMPGTPLWPEIATWADEHGFTAEELAWIQPGYEPNLPWIALGSGTNGPVTITKTLATGDVLVGGDFTEAGGVTASHVAIWNGSGYEALGTGLQGDITSAVEFDGDLYVGGSFLGATNDLARWDGSAWTYSTVFMGKYPHISALHVHAGMLYAAGEEVGIVGSTPLVKRMNGMNWLQVGSAFDAPVLTLASHDGALMAGGAFTSLQGQPVPMLRHVGGFDGNDWSQLGDGLDATVRDLLDVNGTLYAGGDLYANIAVTFGMARIASGAVEWEPLLPNHVNYMPPTDVGPTWIGALEAHNNGIYFGGKFTISPLLGVYGNNLGRFAGTPDQVEALILLDDQVNDVTVRDQHLIIGGAFVTTYPYVATLDLTTGIDPSVGTNTTFSVAPNPSSDAITARLPEGFGANTAFRLIDANGRSIGVNAVRSGNTARIDIKTFPAGSYVIEASCQGRILSSRFVKE